MQRLYRVFATLIKGCILTGFGITCLLSLNLACHAIKGVRGNSQTDKNAEKQADHN